MKLPMNWSKHYLTVDSRALLCIAIVYQLPDAMAAMAADALSSSDLDAVAAVHAADATVADTHVRVAVQSLGGEVGDEKGRNESRKKAQKHVSDFL